MLKQVLGVGVVALGIVGGCAIPAVAGGTWGSVECDQNPHAGCELGAGTGGGSAKVPQGGGTPSRGSHRSGGGSSGGGTAAPKRNPDPDLNLADCSYRRSDYTPPPAAVQTAFGGSSSVTVVAPAVFRGAADQSRVVPVDGPEAGEKGAWYVYRCTQDGVLDGVYRPPVWIADAPAGRGAAPEPSPAQLAQAAHEQLRLPSPVIETSPTGEQLVGLPTWLWVDRGGWGPVSATASVPGVSVTAVAKPTSVVWSMGDGGSVTCAGPGTPYAASAGVKAVSPTCGHTYRVTSAAQAGAAFAVSATVRWSVTWAGAGQGGTFPRLTTTSTAAVRVAQSEALNRE